MKAATAVLGGVLSHTAPSTRPREGRFRKDLSWTTFAETPPASTRTTWSRLRVKKIGVESTPSSHHGRAAIRTTPTTPTVARMGRGIAGHAFEFEFASTELAGSDGVRRERPVRMVFRSPGGRG